MGSANRTTRAIALATLELKLYVFTQALERRYAPGQARVTAGSPDGGQWTDGGGASIGRSEPRRNPETTVQRVASESSLMGRLVAKLPYNVHHVTCIYDFGDALYAYESSMWDGCMGWIPRNMVVPSAGGFGSRLNDIKR